MRQIVVGAGDEILIREGTTTDGDFDVSQTISNAGSGNVTLFAGGNQRPAFLALTGLFLLGLVLLQRVPDPRAVSR